MLAIAATLLAALATPAAPGSAPVAIETGLVQGVHEGPIRVFKGIPYAAAPVGELRWRAPEPAQAWEGIMSADAFSPACPQKGSYPENSPPEPMSEDCLTLNIWTPAESADEKLPVMVWIYGGGLINGSGSTPLYAGDRLAARGVVVVTFNYRLGALGFLAHPELNRESKHGGSGNYGLLDQIAALNWVRRNIAAFGGDPETVTIFGQSSGSFSVSMLAVSPLTTGLFRRAIGQSGGVFEPIEFDPGFTPEGAAAAGERFAARAGDKTLAGLRNMKAAELLEIPFRPQFNIDGFALTKSPYDAYKAGEQHDIDLIVGTNSDEGRYFLAGADVTKENFNEVLTRTFPGWLVALVGAKPGETDADARAAAAAFDGDMRFRWDMWAWARLAASSGRSGVFFYQFSRSPPLKEGDPYFGLGATHGMEMQYVFDHLDQSAGEWTAKDRALASTVPAYWTNFAKTGDPNGGGLPRWPEFVGAPKKVMILGDEVGPADIPDIERLQRIDRVYSTARVIAANLVAVAAAALFVAAALLFLAARSLSQAFRRKRA